MPGGSAAVGGIAPVGLAAGVVADGRAVGAGNKLNPGKPLIFVNSLVPTRPVGMVNGGGVMHEAYARELINQGYDVVVIEANNTLAGTTPYHSWRLLFSPEDAVRAKLPVGPAFAPHVPHNFPIFTSYPTSNQRFQDLPQAQLARYVPLWQWNIEAAMAVYGVPDAVWNGHVWVMNAMTAPLLPTASTNHGTCVDPKLGYSIIPFRAINQYGASHLAMAFGISPHEVQNLVDPSRYALPEAKVALTWNGYNNEVFHPGVNGSKPALLKELGDRLTGVTANDKWVVFVGKAAHFKGLDLLLEATANVRQNAGGSNVHLIVVGSEGDESIHHKDPFTGEDLEPIVHRQLAQRLGINDAVHFVGRHPQGMMARLVKAADAYVLPSRREPFGLVAPEGMGVGATPILSYGGGFIDIVRQHPGEPGDVVRFVDEDNPHSVRVYYRAMEEIARKLEGGQSQPHHRQALEFLERAVLDLGKGKYILPDADMDSQMAAAYAHRKLTEVSHQAAVTSLTHAIGQELCQPPAVRTQRRAAAAQFAADRWAIGPMISGQNMPHIRAMVSSPERADLSFAPSDRVDQQMHPLRRERLDALSAGTPDPMVRSAFMALQASVGEGQEAIGRAWRGFHESMAVYMGTRSSFTHPFDPEAAAFHRPHTILEEAARVAGVDIADMRSAMEAVSKAPTDVLLKPTVVTARPPAGQAGYHMTFDLPFLPQYMVQRMLQTIPTSAKQVAANTVRGGTTMYLGQLGADVIDAVRSGNWSRFEHMQPLSEALDLGALSIGSQAGGALATAAVGRIPVSVMAMPLKGLVVRGGSLAAGVTLLNALRTGELKLNELPQTIVTAFAATAAVKFSTTILSQSRAMCAAADFLKLSRASRAIFWGGAVTSVAEFTVMREIQRQAFQSANQPNINVVKDYAAQLIQADMLIQQARDAGEAVDPKVVNAVSTQLKQLAQQLKNVPDVDEQIAIAHFEQNRLDLYKGKNLAMNAGVSAGEADWNMTKELRRLERKHASVVKSIREDLTWKPATPLSVAQEFQSGDIADAGIPLPGDVNGTSKETLTRPLADILGNSWSELALQVNGYLAQQSELMVAMK